MMHPILFLGVALGLATTAESIDYMIKFPSFQQQHLPGSSRRIIRSSLMQHAQDTQRSLFEHYKNATSNCEGFWIANVVVCKHISSSAAAEIGRLDNVLSVSPLTGLWLDNPLNPEPAKSSVSGEAEPEWNLDQVNVVEAWQTTRGQGTVVAIIDGGVRHTHEALRSSYRGAVASGLSHDYNFYDPVYSQPTPDGSDTDGHGTHVTGTAIGSHGVGVAPDAKWIHAKACNFAGYCGFDWIISAAQWVMCPTSVGGDDADCSLGADIVSCSWGEYDNGDSYLMEITDAWEAAGMVGVFAAGNEGGKDCGTIASPADYATVLGVGATDRDGDLAPFSSLGPSDGEVKNGFDAASPNIVAPGVGVRSAWYEGDSKYYSISGTSMACPLVAGVAALVMSVAPSLSAAEVRSIITSTAERESLFQPGGPFECGGTAYDDWPSNFFGWGRIDAAAAVRAATLSNSGTL